MGRLGARKAETGGGGGGGGSMARWLGGGRDGYIISVSPASLHSLLYIFVHTATRVYQYHYLVPDDLAFAIAILDLPPASAHSVLSCPCCSILPLPATRSPAFSARSFVISIYHTLACASPLGPAPCPSNFSSSSAFQPSAARCPSCPDFFLGL